MSNCIANDLTTLAACFKTQAQSTGGIIIDKSYLTSAVTEVLGDNDITVAGVDYTKIPDNPGTSLTITGTTGTTDDDSILHVVGATLCVVFFVDPTTQQIVFMMRVTLGSSWTYGTSFPTLAGQAADYLSANAAYLYISTASAAQTMNAAGCPADSNVPATLTVQSGVSIWGAYTLDGPFAPVTVLLTSVGVNAFNLYGAVRGTDNGPSFDIALIDTYTFVIPGGIIAIEEPTVGLTVAYVQNSDDDKTLYPVTEPYFSADVVIGALPPLEIRAALQPSSTWIDLSITPVDPQTTTFASLTSLLGSAGLGQVQSLLESQPAVMSLLNSLGFEQFNATVTVSPPALMSASILVGTIGYDSSALTPPQNSWQPLSSIDLYFAFNCYAAVFSPSSNPLGLAELQSTAWYKKSDGSYSSFTVAVSIPAWTVTGFFNGTLDFNLKTLVDDYLGGGLDIPESLFDFSISKLTFSVDIPGKVYAFTGVINGSLLGSNGLQLTDTSVGLTVNASGAQTTYTGTVDGVVSLAGIEFQVDAVISNDPKTKTIFSIHFVNQTVGSMLNMLVHLVDPTYDIDLGSPWNTLLDISLDALVLEVNVTDKTVSLTYTLPNEIDLVFVQITGITLSYKQVPGQASAVNVELDATFFGQKYGGGTSNPPLGWNAMNSNPPAVPSGSVFDLQYLGLGQHVTLSDPASLTTVESVITALQKAMTPLQSGQLPQLNGQGLVFSDQSNWLIGAQFSLLNMISISAVFNDPNLYGILIQMYGPSAKVFAGLKFEILYHKVTDTIGVYHIELKLPDAMRNLQFGSVSITLPVVVLDIYTNGNFKIDMGFPKGLDFSNSFSLQVFPFLGYGGFYFAWLDGSTSSNVPQITNGTFDPVIEFGVALSIGVGKTISFGVFSGGAYVTVTGIVQGVLAWFNPSDNSSKDMYYWIQGSISIVGKVYGKIDFAIIQASVELMAYATVTLTIQAYSAIYIQLNVGVTVRVSVKVVFFTIHLSFSATLNVSFTIGSNSTTPWKVASGGGSTNTNALKSTAAQPSLAGMEMMMAMTPSVTMAAAPMAASSMAVSAMHPTSFRAVRSAKVAMTLSPATEWPAVSVLPLGKQTVTIWALPAFTKSETWTIASNGAVRSGNVVTITTTAVHDLDVNDMVTLSGVGDATFDGTFTVATVPNRTSFTVAQTAADSSSGGGTATAGATAGGADAIMLMAAQSAVNAWQITSNGAVRSGNVATITTTVAHGLNPNDPVTLAGVGDTTFDGTFTVATVPSPTSFTVAQTAADSSSGGGTATAGSTVGIADAGLLPFNLLMQAMLGWGIYVETHWTIASNGAVRSGNTVTFTTTASHNLEAGDPVVIGGVTDDSFDGTFTVATVPSSTSFTVSQSGADAQSGGGTAEYPGVKADQLVDLQQQLDEEEMTQQAFDYATLTSFLAANFVFDITETGDVASHTSVAVFPMPPAITLTDTANTSIVFDTFNEVDGAYQEKILAYFRMMEVQYDSGDDGSSATGNEPTASMSSIVFSYYFNMVMSSAVKAAIDFLASYPYTTTGVMGIAGVGSAIGDTSLAADPIRIISPNQDLTVLNPGAIISLPDVTYQIRSADTFASIATSFAAQGALNGSSQPYAEADLMNANVDTSGILSVGASVTFTGLGYTTLADDTLNLIAMRLLLRVGGPGVYGSIPGLSDAVATLGQLNTSITDPNVPINPATTPTVNLSGGGTYSVVEGDTLTLIGAYFLGIQLGAINTQSFLAALLQANPGLQITDPTRAQNPGTQISIPSVTYAVAAGDTIATIAVRLITTTAIVQTNLAAVPTSVVLLAPQGVMNVPMDYKVATNGSASTSTDTFSSIAAKFNVTLQQVADGSTGASNLFAAGQTITVDNVTSIQVDALMSGLLTQGEWTDSAGTVSRFLMSGLRLPDPNDPYFAGLSLADLSDPTKLAPIATKPMCKLTGQQYPIVAPIPNGYQITLAANPALSWLDLGTGGTLTFGLTQAQADLATTIATTPLVHGIETLTRLALFQMVPPRIALQQYITWQAAQLPAGCLSTGGATGNPTVWLFPDALVQQLEDSSDTTVVASDILYAPSLAAKLQNGSDPVSQYVAGQLSPTTQQLLGSYTKGADSLPLRLALASDLNRIVKGESIYNATRFAGVSVPVGTLTAAGKNPTGSALKQVNRSLLESAYPQDLASSDQSMLYELVVAKHHADDSPVTAEEANCYAWGTIVDFTISMPSTDGPSASVSNAYVIGGADDTGADLLQQVYDYLGSNSDSATLYLLYSPNPTGGSASGLASDLLAGASTWILKTNLSTDTNSSESVAATGTELAAPAATPSDPTTLYAAAITNPEDFIALLWEASITRSGGFYLNYANANGNTPLPGTVFGNSSTATISLLIVLSSQLTSKDATMQPFNNCAVVGDNIDVTTSSLFVQPATYTTVSGDSLTTATNNFNTTWHMSYTVLEVATFNQTVPLLLLVGATMTNPNPTQEYPASYEIEYGDTLAGLVTKLGLANLQTLISAGSNATAAILETGAQMQFANGVLQPATTVPPGTVGFEITRTNPDPQDLPYNQLPAQDLVGSLFNLVGFAIAQEGVFTASGAGLPTTPADSLQEGSDGLTQTDANANNANWYYSQTIAIGPFGSPQNGSASAALPAAQWNPYNGVGVDSNNKNNLVTIDLDLQDIYGNIQTLPTPYNALQVPVGYYDDIANLGSWPSMAISYTVSGATPTVALEMTMQQARYIPSISVTVDSATSAVTADLASYKGIYYQLVQPDISFSLTTTLDADSMSASTPKYPLSTTPYFAFAYGAYIYLAALATMQRMVVNGDGSFTGGGTITGGVTVGNVANQFGVTGAQLLEENQNQTFSALFDAALNVPTMYTVVPGDSLATIVQNPKWSSYGLTVDGLATSNQNVPLGVGADLTIPSRSVPTLASESLNAFGAREKASPGGVATTNASRTDILNQGVVFTVGTSSYTTGASDSFANAASKLGVSVSALGEANQYLTGIFVTSAALNVADVVVASGDTLQSLATAYTSGNVGTLATSNADLQNIFGSGTAITIGLKPADQVELKADDTLLTFASSNGVTVTQLGSLTQNAGTAFTGNAVVNVPQVMTNPSTAQYCTYTARVGDTLTSIATKFNTTTAIITALNAGIPGLLSGGNPVVGSLWICPSMIGDANGANANNTLSGLATAYNIPDPTLLATSNAAAIGFLASGQSLTISGVSITTNGYETLNSLVNRVNLGLAASGSTMTVALADIVTAVMGTNGLINPSARVVPVPSPSPGGNSVPITPKFTDPVFQIAVNVVTNRNPLWIDPDFQDATTVRTSTWGVSPEPDPQTSESSAYTLTQFATMLQASIPNLQVATGDAVAEGDPASASTIWGVNFGSGYGPQITYQFLPSQSIVQYFSIPPLSTALMGGQVEVRPYVTGQSPPFTGTPQQQNFQAVDLDTWMSTFLQSVDLFLSPAYAVPAYAIDPTDTTSVVAQKQIIAQALSNELTWILQGEQGGSLPDAVEAMYQSLLQQLSSAFTVDTVVQMPVSVSSQYTDPSSAPRLSGKIVIGDGTNSGGGTTQAPNAFSFSTAKVPLTSPGANASFLFSVKSPASHKQADLNLEYVISALELPDPSSTIGDYEGSKWLQFILPLENTSSDIGAVQIPVPLKSYPSPVTLIAQSAQQSVPFPSSATELQEWDFGFVYQHDDAEQDTPFVAMSFNVDSDATFTPTSSGINLQAIFEALAQFMSAYPVLKDDLSLLPTLAPGTANAKALAAVQAFNWLVKNVATACQAALPGAGGTEPPATYYYQMQKNQSNGEPSYLTTMTVTSGNPSTGPVPNPTTTWPDIWIQNPESSNQWQKLAPTGTSTNTQSQYTYPASIPADTALTQRFLFNDSGDGWIWAITSNGAARAGGSTTITTATAHGLALGDRVDLTGVGDATFNGSYSVAAVESTTSFVYRQANEPDAQNGGGSASKSLVPLGSDPTAPQTYVFENVNIFSSANGRAGVAIARNLSLVESAATNPAFVYQTPLTSFTSIAVPSIFADNLLAIGSGATTGIAAALGGFMNTLLTSDYSWPTGSTVPIRLAAAYTHTMVSGSDAFDAHVPILLVPSYPFNPATDWDSSNASSFVSQVQAAIINLQALYAGTQGSFLFDLTIYAGDGSLQQLIEATSLQYGLTS